MRSLNAISILFFLSGFLIGAQTYNSNTKSIWEKGKEAERNRQFRRALQIWETAKSNKANSSSSIADARIGFDYIRLATKQKMTAYYQKAVDMYFWSLSQGCDTSNKAALSKELERISPIILKQEYKKWRKNINNNIPAFCESLMAYWKTLDPTLSSTYNERLLEHWERIAYSKEHFKRSRRTIYGTDDRGLIYVRLGRPDVKKDGTLQFNYGLVRSWIQDIIDSQSQTGIALGSFGSDSAGASSSNFFASTNNNIVQTEKLARNALKAHRYPDYEIWVYRNLNNKKHDNLVYIFGQDGDYGTFGLRKSLDEMIPSSAFGKGLVTSGLLLQLLFYEQTSQIDPYFEESYQDLESRILSRNGLNRRTSFIVKDQNRSQLAIIQYNAPVQKTSLVNDISNIKIQSHQYRFLDKYNDPYLATFVESQPQKAIYLEQVKEKKYTVHNYQLIHNMIVVSEASRITKKQSQNTDINLDEIGNTKNMEPSSAYFEVPNIAEGIDQIFTVELYNTNKDSTRISDNIFLDDIRAIGKTKIKQPNPLSPDTKKLEVSDVLIGINEGNDRQAQKGPANFTVIHDKEIPVNNDVMIYFQVYHLKSQATNPNEFQIEYRVTKETKNIFKRIFGNKNKVGLTLNLETYETYYTNNLEIGTSSFEPGNYLLTLKIKEPATSREIEKEVSFEIKEN